MEPDHESWLPAWFRPPTWSGFSTGHHVRPVRPSDDMGEGVHPASASGLRYVLLDDEEHHVLGWIDLSRGDDPAHDAVVTWQVDALLLGSASRTVLDREVSDWVRHEWPFSSPRCGPRAGLAEPPRRG